MQKACIKLYMQKVMQASKPARLVPSQTHTGYRLCGRAYAS